MKPIAEETLFYAISSDGTIYGYVERTVVASEDPAAPEIDPAKDGVYDGANDFCSVGFSGI